MSILYSYLCRRHVLSIIEDAKEKKSTSINLSSFDIEVLPEQLFECGSIEKLYLQSNKLSHINSHIVNLTHITLLTLDYNSLTSLPDEIKLLSNLRNLNISHNPLKNINQICGLKTLEVLWCNNIDMEHLPEDIGLLKELDTFGARGNKIRQLPKSFTQLSKLNWLTLENNLLNKLPADIHKLTSLVHLNVKNNELKSLPINLRRCKKMQYVFVGTNQISIANMQHILNVSYMKHLVYIDARDNPFTKCNNLKDKLVKYPKVRVDDNWTPGIEESEDTPTNEETRQENENVNSTNSESISLSNEDAVFDSELEIENSDSDSVVSEDDWENSYPSSQLDPTDHDDDEIEDNEVFGSYLPELSRYIGTGS